MSRLRPTPAVPDCLTAARAIAESRKLVLPQQAFTELLGLLEEYSALMATPHRVGRLRACEGRVRAFLRKNDCWRLFKLCSEAGCYGWALCPRRFCDRCEYKVSLDEYCETSTVWERIIEC